MYIKGTDRELELIARVNELTAALRLTKCALRECANIAQDDDFFNEGGQGYEAFVTAMSALDSVEG